MARCSQAAACHWVFRQSQNALMAWILLLIIVVCLLAFVAFSVLFCMTSTVLKFSAPLVLLQSFERLLSKGSLAVLLFTLLSLVHQSVHSVFFGKNVASSPSVFIILTSCTEVQSLLLRKFFWRSVLGGILVQNTSTERTVLWWTEMSLNFQRQTLFPLLDFSLLLLSFVSCLLVERTQSSDQQGHNWRNDFLFVESLCHKIVQRSDTSLCLALSRK